MSKQVHVSLPVEGSDNIEFDLHFDDNGYMPNPNHGGMLIGDRHYARLGVVGVDSGHLVVCDPCYIDDMKKRLAHEDDSPTYPYYPFGHSGMGITFPSGFGNGLYAVYGMFNDAGRVASVLIEMIDLEK